MRLFLSLCSAAALVFASTATATATASAREPLVLAPVKPWNLHYSENSCQLFRSFGDPANPTNMVFESLGPDSSMTMMVFGGALTSKSTQGAGKVSFLPGAGRSFDGGKISATTKGKQTAIYWSGVTLLPESEEDPKEVVDRARQRARQIADREVEKRTAASVTAVQVTEPRERVVVLQTGSFGKVMEMVRQCNREQMAGWGLDPAVQDKIVLGARATRNLASLFTDKDYPTEAIRSGEMSVVAARLIVGADGKVARCTPLTPFSGEGFKEVVCARLSKAVFEPAELADGTRVPSFTITRIDFRIP